MKANKTVFLVTMIALLALSVTPVFSVASANGGCHDYISNLYAGRDHQIVGLVLVDWVDDDTIRVIYETDGCWSLVETHLMVADSFEDIPMTQKGNPKIGHFDYAMEHDPMVTTATYFVDVDGDGEYFIAAHAVVYCDCSEVSETAWGQGCNSFEFPGNSWALYFTFSD
jgi:hypothetical protein